MSAAEQLQSYEPPKIDTYDVRVFEAVASHRRGWAVTPLNGKVPKLKRWQAAPAPSDETAFKWAVRGNYGIRTGSVSGIVVLDVDPKSGGQIPFQTVTPTVQTGGGGWHLYFKAPEGGLGNSASKLGTGIDVRGDGGQVVGPGSAHPETGARYEWLDDLTPEDVELAELPEEILAKLREQPQEPQGASQGAARPQSPASARKALEAETEAVGAAQKGSRNATLNRAAYSLGRHVAAGLLDRETAVARLRGAAETCGLIAEDGVKPTLDTIDSGLRAGARHPHVVAEGPDAPRDELPELSDVAAANRLLDRLDGSAKHCKLWESWLLWDGTRWKPDEGQYVRTEARNAAEEFSRELLARARMASGKKEATSLEASARGVLYRHAIANAVSMAEIGDGVPVQPDQLDSDSQLVNLQNGTFDLREGEFRPHDPERLVTKVAPVAYDPHARCPRWEQFVSEIMKGDEELIEFLQRAAGYSLTGEMKEQCFFVLLGNGRNGKSTFIDTLFWLLGDYALAPKFSTFTEKSPDAIPNDVARLKGARLISASEGAAGAVLDEGLLKDWTSGDKPISARYMRAEWFDFYPEGKIWLDTNYRPRIKGQDDGIWRRVRLIPFNAEFSGPNADPDLAEKLRAEASGILNWVLDGCFRWQEAGLQAPEAVRVAVQEYREDSDVLGEFLAECCESGPGFWEPSGGLHERYVRWAKACGVNPLGLVRFSQEIQRRGFIKQKGRSSNYFEGIRIAS